MSVKGVVCQEPKVILLKNECDEWELPEGKLELGEDPECCCIIEIKE
ncbi:NUDIX domain-containing protein [Nostoc sp.]